MTLSEMAISVLLRILRHLLALSVLASCLIWYMMIQWPWR